MNDRRKIATVLGLVAILGGMTTLTAFAVPLYNLFCRVTGYGGTTQVAETATGRTIDRVITIRFNADINPALPWQFEPVKRSVAVRVGEPQLAFFRAHSLAATATAGTATFNVVPAKAGLYFDKIQCFCFTEQSLAPGETADMPVQFFVDPAIADDRNLDDVDTITLSYTFFRSENGAESRPARAALKTKSVANGNVPKAVN